MDKASSRCLQSSDWFVASARSVGRHPLGLRRSWQVRLHIGLSVPLRCAGDLNDPVMIFKGAAVLPSIDVVEKIREDQRVRVPREHRNEVVHIMVIESVERPSASRSSHRSSTM